jgi:hypothetical protein
MAPRNAEPPARRQTADSTALPSSAESPTPPGFHPLQLKRHSIYTQNRHRRSETGPSAEQGNAFGQNNFDFDLVKSDTDAFG